MRSRRIVVAEPAVCIAQIVLANGNHPGIPHFTVEEHRLLEPIAGFGVPLLQRCDHSKTVHGACDAPAVADLGPQGERAFL